MKTLEDRWKIFMETREDGWKIFNEIAIPENALEYQYKDMKMAFYGGILTVIHMMADVNGADESKIFLENMMIELEDFYQKDIFKKDKEVR